MKENATAALVRAFDRAYINGKFVVPHGTHVVDLVNPTNNTVIGKVTMADEIDTRQAIAAAKEAFNTFSQSGKEYRMDCLQRLHDGVAKRMDQLVDATVVEYGAPQDRAKGSNNLAANIFLNYFEVQENVRREVVRALRAVLASAVFHNRRVNELIHSHGNAVRQPQQAVHPEFLDR